MKIAAKDRVLIRVSHHPEGHREFAYHVMKAMAARIGRPCQSRTCMKRKELFVAENMASSEAMLEVFRRR